MAKGEQRLKVGVQCACDWPDLPSKSQVRSWVRAAADGSTIKGGRVTVRFVDGEEGRRLNRDYRARDYPTNVLSFPYRQQPLLDGDLVLCAPVVADEACAQEKPLTAHYAHLVVHGMLHLQGYDHEAGAKQAAAMERRERQILARLGYPDPYRDVRHLPTKK